MSLIRSQEPFWLNTWLSGVLSFRADRAVHGHTSADRVRIEEAILNSIRPYHLGSVDRRYVAMSRIYNEAYCALSTAHYVACLGLIEDIQAAYFATRRHDQREFATHAAEWVLEATIFWKANLMEIMIVPLSLVSPIIQKTQESLPRGVVLDVVISNAHAGIVPGVFREFVRLCDCLDTRPQWFFDTSGNDWGELEEEGFLPVDEELQHIRLSLCRNRTYFSDA
ncbi:MAG: hypothetical protein Q9211_000946 [Gyalolechia sp. 1 TL-2023]